MRCHPMRWLWGLIPIAMLAWLAVQTEHSYIERDLERRSTEALRGAGHDWAVVAFDGRDGLLAGQPRDRTQLAEAANVVRNVWGVRVVRMRSIAPDIKDMPITPATDGGTPGGVLRDSAPPLPLGDSVPVASADVSAGHDAMIANASVESSVWSEARQSEPVLGHAREADGTPEVTVATHEVSSVSMGASMGAAEATPVAVSAVPEPAEAQAAESQADAVTAADAQADPAVAASSAGESAAAEVAAVASAPAPSSPPRATDDAHSVAAATPSVPERKPVVVARADTSTTHEQGAAAVSSWLSGAGAPEPAKPEPTKPQSAKPGRFDTAALPPGNIVESASCIDRVKDAARRAEVHFARGDTRIDASGKGVLDGLVGALNICPEAMLHIAGHADSSGKSGHNKVLSRHRARGVASYLIHKGIDDGRLIAVGYGDQKPVAPNDSKANRAKNRRIELTVAARAAPLPPMPVRKQGTRNGLSAR